MGLRILFNKSVWICAANAIKDVFRAAYYLENFMSNPATIMIVDDSATNRMILEEMVQELGHKPETAVNGKEGLDKIRKKMPDVLLLDIMMPIMNGYQVLEALKADPATRNLPVLVISAVDEMESVLQCIKNGAEDYLPKPLNMLLLKA